MKVLVVDDEKDLCELIEEALRGEGHEVCSAWDGGHGLAKQDEIQPDLILLDLHLPDQSGLDVYERLRAKPVPPMTLIMTGEDDVRIAVEAMKAGVEDYLAKPLDLEALCLQVNRIEKRLRVTRQLNAIKEQRMEQYRRDYLFLPHDRMKEIYEQIEQVAKQDKVTTLIMGETGTGKEHVARLIHDLSPRAEKPFVEIHCGALPENLLESELFGYEAGAFTDAKKAKAGLFEVGQGGTVFLDEIGEMPLSTQVKLLKVLEEKKLRRLGSVREAGLDVRVIAATNRRLEKEMMENHFRPDLFYRLNVFRIEIPPLRERREDIEALALFFFKDASRAFGKKMEPPNAELIEALKDYAWPGNVRELKNVVERMVISSRSSKADRSLLPPEIKAQRSVQNASEESGGVLSADGAEKRNIEKALGLHRGNRTKTAQQLGISRRTLLNKIRRYGLDETSQS